MRIRLGQNRNKQEITAGIPNVDQDAVAGLAAAKPEALEPGFPGFLVIHRLKVDVSQYVAGPAHGRSPVCAILAEQAERILVRGPSCLPIGDSAISTSAERPLAPRKARRSSVQKTAMPRAGRASYLDSFLPTKRS